MDYQKKKKKAKKEKEIRKNFEMNLKRTKNRNL